MEFHSLLIPYLLAVTMLQARSQGGYGGPGGARPPGVVRFDSVPPLKTLIIPIYALYLLAVPPL